MRIDELQLAAVGPFSGTVLDLSKGAHGLHLIYGPNEAGKSSALRAIRYLLFGFPSRLSDDFRHPYSSLRVGAQLRNDQGEALCCVRRKASQKSLRDAQDDREVDEKLLRRFLGGAGEDLFVRCFGIDHPTLVQGGQEIVRGEGELGRLLFSGTGLAHLRELDHQLEKEAKELFAPQAKNPTINRVLRELKEARRQVRECQLRPAEWERHYNALQDALRLKTECERTRDDQRRQRDRLERIQAALPRIAEYLDALDRHAILESVVLLPADFNARREAALQRLSVAQAQCDSTLEEIRQRDSRLTRLEVPENVLAHGDRIASLEKQLHRYEDALADRPLVTAGLHTLEREAQTVLRELGEGLSLDEASSLLLPQPERAKIQQLAALYSALVKDVDDSRQALEESALEAKQLQHELNELPNLQDPQSLRQALNESLKLGDIEARYNDTCAELRVETEEAAIEVQRLAGWSGELAQLETMSVPALETVERFAEQVRLVDDQQRLVEEQLAELQRNYQQSERELNQLRARHEVPSTEQLVQLRQNRDRVWRLLRRRLGNDPHGAAQSGDEQSLLQALGLNECVLEEAYEQLVTATDNVADRLRHEADRVARHGQLIAELDQLRSEISRFLQQRDEQQQIAADVQQRWRALWQSASVEPLSPREMRAWLTQYQVLLGRARNVRDLARKVELLADALETEKRKLGAELQACRQPTRCDASSFSALIESAQQALEAWQESAAREREVRRDLQRAQKEHQQHTRRLATAETKLRSWQQEWQNAVSKLPSGSRESPAVVNQVLELLHQLSLKLNSVEQQRSRLQEIDSFCTQFAQQAQELLRQVLPELSQDRSAGDAAALTIEHYRRAVELDKERRRLRDELTERQARHEAAQAEAREARGQLEQLCREASCESPSDLPKAWSHSEEKRRTTEAAARLCAQLRELSGAMPLEDFIDEARAEDAETLPRRLEELNAQILQLDERLVNEVGPAIGREDQLLKHMDSSGQAAAAEETARDLLAGLANSATEYATLRVAQLALRYALERYRERHQGPLLQVASETFARLTAGAFDGLKVDYGPEGNPLVMGVRAGTAESVAVSCMSDGTADQLYFALRYAWLLSYLDANESLPFIVDDILMRFDDERAVQTLQTLADLSRRTQVLFFTHHRHLIACARSALSDDVLFIHELTRG